MEKEKDFTKREKFDAIIGYLCQEDNVAIDVQTLVDFCQNEIDKLDSLYGKAKARREAKKAEPDLIIDKVYDILSETWATADDIAEAIGEDDITVGKVRNRLATLVRDGKAKKQEMKVPATNTRKATKAMCYIKVEE